MAAPIAVNVSTRSAILWTGRQRTPDINSLLLMNTDVTHTVMVGSDLTALVIPIPPNGSLTVDPIENWYVIGSAAGSAPLVVIPNGQANFRAITQGLGGLAIPSVFSPNFVTGVSGWSINEDGSAEFNNLVARGNITFPDGWLSNGDGTYTNTPGLYIYNGTPAAGNLIFSAISSVFSGASDKFGNNALPGDTEYDNALLLAMNRSLGSFFMYTFTANPGAAFTQQGQITTSRGILSGNPDGGIQIQSYLQLVSSTNEINIQINSDGMAELETADQITLGLGQLVRIVGTNTTINSTTPITLMTVANLRIGFWRITGIVRFTSNAGVVQPLNIRFLGTATCSAIEISTRLVQEAANVTTFNGVIQAQNTDPSVIANWGNNTLGRWEYSGIIHVTTAGSWVLAARVGTSAADETFTVFDNSWMECVPYG